MRYAILFLVCTSAVSCEESAPGDEKVSACALHPSRALRKLSASGTKQVPEFSPPVLKGLELRITLPKSGGTRLAVEIVNKSPKTVTLVKPGDGSESGWRTPVIEWSVLGPGEADRQHPSKPRGWKYSRCGNINALKRDEVATLAPGEKLQLGESVDAPKFARLGTYRVVFYYRNCPKLKWKGLPLGIHDPTAMKLVRASTPCLLKSKETIIQVDSDKNLKLLNNARNR